MSKATRKPKQEKPKAIHIEGRRWFQRTYGNTYHTVTILVDGKRVHTTEKSYGYGDQYRQSAEEWLIANGYLPRIKMYEHGGNEPIRRYCDRKSIIFTDSVLDVKRERDL